MPAVTIVVPGELGTHTGGYIYDKRVAEGLQRLGWTVDVRELDASFPQPTDSALSGAAAVLAGIADGSVVLVDGLAFSAMPAQVASERSRLRLVALIHLPLASDASLPASVAAALRAGERRALASAARVIVTGRCTQAALADYGVDAARIALVHPGTDRAPLSRGSGGPLVQLLTVATLTRRKAHDVLFRALAALPRDGWHLTCVGSLEREPDTVHLLRERLRDEGLEAQVTLAGDVSDQRLAEYYRDADLFVLATLHETYGMAVAEALAHGLPVISTTDPAVSELVEDDAGLLVEPGNVGQLSHAIGRVIDDPILRERLAAGARRVRDRLPTWEEACERMAAVLSEVVASV